MSQALKFNKISDLEDMVSRKYLINSEEGN